MNPKTVIRIKDNVTDPVLRNKMLIACALNNVKPVGNLPEDFNFAALRDFVKQTDAKDYDALAEILYTPQENEFNLGSELSVADTRRDRAANIVYRETPVERRETRPEYRTAAGREENKERRDTPVVPVVVNPGRSNGGNITATETIAIIPSAAMFRPVRESKKKAGGVVPGAKLKTGCLARL